MSDAKERAEVECEGVRKMLEGASEQKGRSINNNEGEKEIERDPLNGHLHENRACLSDSPP